MMRGGRDTASFMTQGGRGFASLAAACLLVFACMLGTFGLVAYAQESQSSSAAAASNGVALTDASLALHLGVLAQDAAAGMDDGTYQVEVVLTGGTGKATVESPAELAVSDGQATARLVWSSPYYDYMVVGGQKYLPVNESGNSEFLVPVIVFDKPVLYTEPNIDRAPYDACWLDEELWIYGALPQLGMKMGDGANVGELVQSVLGDASRQAYRDSVRSECWEHPGEAAIRVVDYLVDKQRELSSGEAEEGASADI